MQFLSRDLMSLLEELDRILDVTGKLKKLFVLGELRPKSTMRVITEIDLKCGALFPRNPCNAELHDRTAFFDVDDTIPTVSGDLTELLRRNGTIRSPAAKMRTRLSGKERAALNPRAAVRVSFDLAAGKEREIVFRFGAGRDAEDAGNPVNCFRGSTTARGALDVVSQLDR